MSSATETRGSLSSKPISPPSQQQQHQPYFTSSYLSYPVTYAVSGLIRRLTEPSIPNERPTHANTSHSLSTNMNGVYTPPRRHASPFQPPPLTPLTLRGIKKSTSPSARLLSRALAEEIRLLIPPRLQLVNDWTLAYSVEQDGTSLATLYQKCDEYGGRRSGFVLVVRDGSGGIFGAYLTDPPRPSPSYYGTGECFLWRASLLPTNPSLSTAINLLPPPPSADTTHLQRSTTLSAPSTMLPSSLSSSSSLSPSPSPSPSTHHHQHHHRPSQRHHQTQPLIRFKAFPYSGINDYTIYCEHTSLSVGGGDGHYGLWLDGVLERGVSASCLTFGNEPLSEEGIKFEVLGVEVWYVGRGLDVEVEMEDGMGG
ncbi:oxidation resistance protein 1 [Acarospora aff. strigata]|nr:oxidation resistance protein 1 [Acarospora aff. strigata]